MKKKRNVSWGDALGWLLMGIGVLMLGKSVTLCFGSDIWYDELFTVSMAEHSYGELVRFTAADVHPPLYYIIVKIFSELCKLIMPEAGTVIPAKLVSVLPYVLLLLYSVTWIRKRWGIFTGGLFFFCVTAMPQLPAYTVEVRMYGWALFFVTAAFWHAHGCLMTELAAGTGLAAGKKSVAGKDMAAGKESPGGAEIGTGAGCGRYFHGAVFVLYSLAAAYTQYFAAVAVGMVYLYLLFMFLCRDRSRLREWLCYVGVSAVGYAPWLFALARQIGAVRENYWILPLTWRSLGGCVKFLMKPVFMNDVVNTVLAVVLFGAYAAVVGYSVFFEFVSKNREKEKKLSHNVREIQENRASCILAGVGVLAGVVAFGFAVSILLRPIFVYRYMVPAMGCFWFSFALGVDLILCKPQTWTEKEDTLCKLEAQMEAKERLCKPTNPTDSARFQRPYPLGIFLTILTVAVGLQNYRAFCGEEEYKIVSMRETETALSLIAPEDIVIYNFDQVQAVTAYYLPRSAERFLWRGSAEALIQEMIGACGTLEDAEEIRALARQQDFGERRDVKAGHRRSVWFIGSFNSRDDIVEEWRQAGLTVEEMGSFLLERYWFNLYKIS